jgi:hypothetical protein
MPFRVFTTGEVLTDTLLQDYLMEQVVITCTSGTRPSSPTDGMVIFETDTDMLRAYSNGSWTVVQQLGPGSHTPVLTASTSNPTLGTGSSQVGRYLLWGGRMCTYWGRIAFGTAALSAGTGQYFVSLPFVSNSAPEIFVGSAMLRDSSSGSIQPCTSYMASGASTLSIVTPSGIASSTVPWTWAASDYLTWSITYETV